MDMGPLAFCPGSHHIEKYRNLIISDESEAKIQEMFDEMNSSFDESPFDLGEISFHYGWTFHRAGENKSDRVREIMTIIYMDIDMVITREDELWCPNTPAGQIPNNSTNFVIYQR
jgi:ectoine hydroxylase-related dioxygenase (phytanoyl-CoA dioxygenase family)